MTYRQYVEELNKTLEEIKRCKGNTPHKRDLVRHYYKVQLKARKDGYKL